MIANKETLSAFLLKHPPLHSETSPPPEPATGDGPFNLDNLEARLQAWADNNKEFTFESHRTSKGQGFQIRCPGDILGGWSDGAEHGDMIGTHNPSMAVWIADGLARFSCRHSHCNEGAARGKKTWKDLQNFFDPGEKLYCLRGHVTVGGKPPIQAPPDLDLDSIKANLSVKPVYPVDIWAGSEYAEFAEICQKGNFIPPEFFIEAIKTATGAVAGRNLRAAVEGGLPRFYTVLMNSGGSGKGTAIKYARSVYREGWGAAPMLWSPVTKMEDVAWTTAGACQVAFSSAPGMQRTLEKGQTRWLQIYEELSSMIESTKGDGYGESLLAAIRQLYDGEDFTTTATAKRDACSGEAQNSILAATTPQLWEGMFAKTQSEGSGLFQRFNLIAAENIQRVGTLKTPILEGFSGRMTARVEMLQANPICLSLTQDAVEAIDAWYGKMSAPLPDGNEPDPDEYGRLNVLAWRNALHLAWLRGSKAIELKDAEKAIRLSDYQHLVRIKYKPATGDHSTAILEERIRRIVTETGKITERNARQVLNANRAGLGVWSNALRNLIAEGDITRVEEKSTAGQVKKWLVRKQRG